MNEESVFDQIGKCADVLKLDFNSAEMAKLADERAFTPEQLDAVAVVFDCLKGRKKQAVIDMLLNTSRLPLKVPKTFENYDYSRIHGKNADSLRNLSSLTEVYGGRNVALIGRRALGKRIWLRPMAESVAWKGLKPISLRPRN